MRRCGLAAVVLLLVAGCGDPEVPRYDVPAVDADACAGLIAALPDTVSDQPRRDVSGSPYAAAYGDPAIVLRCGVGTPAGFDQFSSCQTVNGLDWFVADTEEVAADQSRDVLMTTVGRQPRVEVSLPATYRPPTTAMVDLGPVITAHSTPTTPCV